ncbi:hypothetical protein BST12_19950 [Mycobacterium angelicum]|uniref:Nitroreductase domain-containing protein n=1 Tax=Mycobacterium angelicum TaxID=470074 RepID=A0A1W9ZK72_MYCAN|nr:hypothetical protein BST12_19950 [Mycobacterium angelicum]
MNAQFPDAETLWTVLALATRAPSIYNTQPWHWRVGNARLGLYADPSMQLRNADPDERDLILTPTTLLRSTCTHKPPIRSMSCWQRPSHDGEPIAGITVRGKCPRMRSPQWLRDAIRCAFGTRGWPQMLARVGWAPINADPLPATPRRRLFRVVARPDHDRPDLASPAPSSVR